MSSDDDQHKTESGTNQFVILGGELGEPLVKLQDGYYSHQIPEDKWKKTSWSLNFVEIIATITTQKHILQ